MRRRSLACAVGGAAFSVLFFATPLVAHAEPTAADKASAELLFDEARKLMKDGKFELACPKLVESQRLDAGVGTLIYLADCYHQLGRTASAWATWREASAAARASGQVDREQLAKKKAEALEPSLPRLVLLIHDATPGLEVRHDGGPVAAPLWGSPIPIDPGEHVVEASASGRAPFRHVLKIEDRQRVEVVIPELAAVAVAPAPVVAPAPAKAPALAVTPAEVPPPYWTTSRITAAGLAGAGVVAVGVGAVFGLKTFSSWADAEGQCTNGRCPNEKPLRLAEEARSSGTVSTIAFVAGGALIAGGAALWFLGSNQRTGRVQLASVITAGGGAVIAGGAF